MDNITESILIKLALCPGSPDGSEVCASCSHLGKPNCRKELQQASSTSLIKESQPKQEACNHNLIGDVTDIMHRLGVPAHILGYQYMREAIMIAVNNVDAIKAITKVLYPQVAKTFHTTPSRVERAIRHAVEVAWDRGDLGALHQFFGYTVSNTRGKPTNSEFIALIADRLRLNKTVQ